MQLHKARRRYGCEINIAPLIDIIFLLIIFFMTVSQISRVEVEALELPEAKQADEGKGMLSDGLIINIKKTGRMTVSGAVQTIDTLRGLLSEKLRERKAEDLSVLIRGDKDTPWPEVNKVLELCASHGVSKVRVAVVKPGQSGD